MSTTADVLVVGGGVIGLTTAYYLGSEGVRVTVVDRGDLGAESSWAGAGIISSGNPARAHTPLGQLKARSAAVFPELSAELRELTGIDNGYVRCGGLELRRSADDLERQRIARVVRQERGEGSHCEILDARQLRLLEPALADTLAGGVLFAGMAQVRNPRHLKALMAGCTRRGVRLVPGWPVLQLERLGDRLVGVRGPDGVMQADHYILTAGSWTDQLLNQVGHRGGIRPVRGQIVLLNLMTPLFNHILQIGSQYLVPRLDGRVLVGSTEEEVGFDRRTTAEAIQGLLRLALEVVPALGKAQIERTWAGLRPGNADGRPVLGPAPGFSNLFVAAGHFRTGIHLSAITGQILRDVILGRMPSAVLEPFSLGRFPVAPAQKNPEQPS